ncbi:hypothetical protein EI534_28245 [Pseudomonas frederiksbergensis]|nr:hypothetical protein [Pseudomonas frederiksbergensis]
MPAMAVCQVTSMLTVLPSSRASPLPQWSVLFAKFVYVANYLVGASLLAMAVCQATSMAADMASSRASPLPQGLRYPAMSGIGRRHIFGVAAGKVLLRSRTGRAARNTRRPWR